jgi:hypothetical protein
MSSGKVIVYTTDEVMEIGLRLEPIERQKKQQWTTLTDDFKGCNGVHPKVRRRRSSRRRSAGYSRWRQRKCCPQLLDPLKHSCRRGFDDIVGILLEASADA